MREFDLNHEYNLLPLGPIGEPVTRPDGYEIQLARFSSGVVCYVDGIGKLRHDEELITLGEGNWKEGLVRLAQLCYKDPSQPYLKRIN